MIANYSHKWWYYAISVLLIIATLLLLIYSPFHRANALVATGVAIAAVLALLAAWGVTTVASNLTSSQLQDYVDGKMQEYAGSLGESVNTLFNNSLLGATATGLLAVGSQFVNAVRGFANWLITDESLTTEDEQKVINIEGNFLTINTTASLDQQITSQNCPQYGIKIYNTISLNQDRYFVYNGPQINACYYDTSLRNLVFISDVNDSAKYMIPSYIPNGTFNSTLGTGGTNVSWSSRDGVYYFTATTSINNSIVYLPVVTSLNEAIEIYKNGVIQESYLQMGLNTNYDIPETSVEVDNRYLVNVGALEGTDLYGIEDQIIDGVLDNTLEATYEEAPVPVTQDVNIDTISTTAISSIQSAVQSAIQSAIQQSEAIQVNTDHHILGFTLPSFDLNLSGIWHYVHDAVGTASPFINFLKNMLTSVPWLAIPLYMSFTLIVVLGVFRRFLH